MSPHGFELFWVILTVTAWPAALATLLAGVFRSNLRCSATGMGLLVLAAAIHATGSAMFR